MNTLYFYRRGKALVQLTASSLASVVRSGRVILLVAGACSVDALAYIEPDDDVRNEYNTCIAKFTAAGLRDLVDELNRSKHVFKIRKARTSEVNKNDADKEDSKNGRGTSVELNWNPNDTTKYDKDLIYKDPCATLYHEMRHLVDYHRGTNDARVCEPYNVTRNEVQAVQAENRYRRTQPDLKEQIRKRYDGYEVPDPPSCETEATIKPESRGCGTGCAASNGDVHLTTFDNRFYDFHAVGEFILAKLRAGSGFEIQSRQQSMQGSMDVSINSAIGMNVNGDRVSVYMQRDGLLLMVNGKTLQLKELPIVLPQQGRVLYTVDNEIEVLWPDQSRAYMFLIGSYGIRLRFAMSESLKGKLEGLLGNYDGDPANDLVIRDGPVLSNDSFSNLYGRFSNSWRVEQNKSLFEYGPNESTKSFTDLSLPRRPIEVDRLPGTSDAKKVCRNSGITSAQGLRECIFDVAVTGRVEFAQNVAQTEALTKRPIMNGAASSSGLIFSGVKSGSFVVSEANCTHLQSQSAPEFRVDLKGNLNGAVVESSFHVLNNFHGVGTYEMGSVVSSAANGTLVIGDEIFSTDGSRIGRLTINTDLRSGVITQTFVAKERSVTVNGAWRCALRRL